MPVSLVAYPTSPAIAFQQRYDTLGEIEIPSTSQELTAYHRQLLGQPVAIGCVQQGLDRDGRRGAFRRQCLRRAKRLGQLKTANVLFAVGLDPHGQKCGIRAFALHPGGIPGTGLEKHVAPEQLS